MVIYKHIKILMQIVYLFTKVTGITVEYMQ